MGGWPSLFGRSSRRRSPRRIPCRGPSPRSNPAPGSRSTAGCGDPEVGLFVAVVAGYNSVPPGALATAEHLIAPGGLVLGDATTEVVPGCCCGLENWRVGRDDLAGLLTGVHRDLTAFAAALAGWADRHTADGPALAARLDAAFAFTAPFPDATARGGVER